MKIEKKNSGYRARKTYNGKTYAAYFDHKPTQKEALRVLSQKMEADTNTGALTFERACKQYLDVKKKVLSPSSLKSYTSNSKQISDHFNKIKMSDISVVEIQRELNRLAEGHSPKYVRSFDSLIKNVVGMYRPDINIKTTLPAKKKKEPYIPTVAEVRTILKEAEGTKYYIPLALASFGMRRSEICALTAFDIQDDIVTINKALVASPEGGYIVKDTTKNTTSTRKIAIPHDLAKMIRKQGYVYRGNPNSITDWLSDKCKELGIEHFSMHKLRHFSASMLKQMGISDLQIQSMHGWSTDYVMKQVYLHDLEKGNLDNMREIASAYSEIVGQDLGQQMVQ